MAKVILFGVKDFAELAHYYLTHDSQHVVVAFSVNQEYLPEGGVFCGLPVVPFETVETVFPPGEFAFFAPLAPRGMSQPRAEVYRQIKDKGYELISYVSSKATMFDNPIGDNCFILENNTLQPFTTIGNNVVMWSGNHIGHHGRIDDHAFFTSHVVLSGHCMVESYSFFGVNATIRDGMTIAEGSFIAMAAAVCKSTEPWGVYRGNPAERAKMSSKDLKF
ncbi:sugar O-acyltransferase (sialic acid O-acetyltransferase NeuD family) [Actimicrobium sp. GrIS 1.19]|uniref:acetyltransferase n=1 Tax=Actimicrobium sp. GrIS 1.19 TaxID=3071708 RepID=UPI002E0C57A2|nr:sugar O-acyltransferase (sialic acid O-acetyltransferase NeuD family) [Actimicrobium sp. GrIS 1.19]